MCRRRAFRDQGQQVLRSALMVVFLVVWTVTTAQTVSIGRNSELVTVDPVALELHRVAVPGTGADIQGLDLLGNAARYTLGDDPAFAERDFADTAWARLSALGNGVGSPAGVYWVRVSVQAADALRGTDLLLSMASLGAFSVYINGRCVLQSDSSLPALQQSGDVLRDDMRRYEVPVRFLHDGPPEVVALRVGPLPSGEWLKQRTFLSLHARDVNFATQRRMMHFGLFVGIDLIIMLLAWVIGRSDKARKGWFLLVVLAGVSALSTLTTVAGTDGLLGMPTWMRERLYAFNVVLLPWPMYLLVRVLASMGAPLSAKRLRWFTGAAISVSLIGVLANLAATWGWVDTSMGFAVDGEYTALIVLVLVLGLVLAGVLLWLSLAVLRMGIRLLRTGDMVGWVGGGAVASSLLALLFHIVAVAMGSQWSGWLVLVADYCTYVAVPVSVAVYLALRAAHHNRLVARQRDELDQEVQERTAELRAERDRSEELLLNILPAEVAEELKVNGTAEPRHYDRVTVLFTDFKGFTDLAAQVSPAALVAELNTCFAAFDKIIDARGIEKIKTIGDAYMCAAGLPDPHSATALDVVLAALEMQDFMEQRRLLREAEGLPAFAMRLGIHSGPVIAGIVGVKKFQYDIWGDTVNTASRMESSGATGRVNMSLSTYALVQDTPDLRFTARGAVEAKGKGALEMYFVERG